jgi:hypothetical protein
MSHPVVQEITVQVPTRESSPTMQRLLVPFVVLAGIAAIQLYLFPTATDRFFAWSLTPPESAMFMGAGYTGGVVLTVLSFGRRPWETTRIAALAVLVFVVAMTATTFLHLDPMHLTSDIASARVAAWLWVGVYVVVTPVLAVLFVREQRLAHAPPPAAIPLGTGLRTSLVAVGATMLVLGILLFVIPVRMDAVWPWPITALSGRALASWLLSIGTAAVWVAWEDDRRRSRPAAITVTIIGVLWIVAVLRDLDSFRWERPSAWVYVGFVAVLAAIGLWGSAAAAATEDSPAVPADRPSRR